MNDGNAEKMIRAAVALQVAALEFADSDIEGPSPVELFKAMDEALKLAQRARKAMERDL